MKLTHWFPGHVLPVRDRVYERDYSFSNEKYFVNLCKFEKGVWFCYRESVYLASREKTASVVCDAPWRGLTKNVEA